MHEDIGVHNICLQICVQNGVTMVPVAIAVPNLRNSVTVVSCIPCSSGTQMCAITLTIHNYMGFKMHLQER